MASRAAPVNGRAVRPLPRLRAAVELVWRDGCLERLAFVPETAATDGHPPSPFPQLEQWLEAYQDDPARPPPAVPYCARGTPFQRRVWRALSRIPAGQTRTYGQLAAQVGSVPRAVAGACRANPWVLLVPCHRVVAAIGTGGFMGRQAGWALALKERLLEHEGVA